MSDIAYCQIFPPIGIARLGDSTDEDAYYIGPELPSEPARAEGQFSVKPHRKAGFTFRDGQGRIKRQAARFRVYGFDAQDNLVREITADEASITWRARLANTKAAWFQFLGTRAALETITGQVPDDELGERSRNRNVDELKAVPGAPVGARYQPSDARAAMLEIMPDEVSICGVSEQADPDDPSPPYAFVGKFKQVRPVYLGELRTDDKGRLLVLGGHGKSDAVDAEGKSIRSDRWIQDYANNDDWYDDTSDGYVRATVKLKDGDREIEVRGGAWVIVASPRFSPDTDNLVSLFDVMEEVLHDNPALSGPESGTPLGPASVDYARDIQPILQRAFDYAWVNDSALRGHGYGKPGDFRNALTGALGDRDSDSGRALRKRIFERIRIPTYLRPTADGPPRRREVAERIAREQASFQYMPPLSGDQGDVTVGRPSTWLTVTHLQYDRLEAWSRDEFQSLPKPKNTEEEEAAAQAEAARQRAEEIARHLPYWLTRTALDDCTGGAFFPGIEMTSTARHPSMYRSAYRLNDDVLGPGDVTKHMALPWQADFFECRVDWWPAQRPDDVLTSADLDEIFASFQEETIGDSTLFESALFNRKRWDRGLGGSRPSVAFLTSRLLPEPRKKPATDGSGPKHVDTLESYIDRLATAAADNLFGRTDASGFTSGRIAGALRYPERLPSPWRIQFTAQEELDKFSGRFFHAVVPAPEVVFRDPPAAGGGSAGDTRPPAPKPLAELRASWGTFRAVDPRAPAFIAAYADAVEAAVGAQIRSVFAEHPAARARDDQPPVDVEQYWQTLTAQLDRGVREPDGDFPENSDAFRQLRFFQMGSRLLDVLYMLHTNQAGDMDMVEMWRHLGFVVAQTREITDRDKRRQQIRVLAETERDRYAGLSHRDYFYYFMNIAKYPDFPAYAKTLADGFLEEAESFIDLIGLQDPDHPESLVEYNETNFNARMEQIYEILRSQAQSDRANSPWLTRQTRAEAAKDIIAFTAFNQTDGSWLRNISRAGTSDELQGLLFDVWSDEIGNGNPLLHHGNLYTALVRQLGVVMPEVSSRAYADHPAHSDRLMVAAVVPLAISQHTNDYFPEILGMTLYLEWEVLSLVPSIKQLEYLGIDPHFYRMHVGIDNATNGHGWSAKRAVELYLDNVGTSSGPEAVQAHWRRVWRGYVAFALSGGALFGNGTINDDDITRQYPATPGERVVRLMEQKRRFGNLQHGRKKIGGFQINDLFDEPGVFIDELANSPWVTAGAPERSSLLTHLTTFQGPMYKVFDAADLETWRDWIVWLAKEGDTPSPKAFLGKGEAMLALLTELRELAMSEPAHTRYALGASAAGGAPPTRSKVADLFAEPDLKKLMRALADPANGWIVRGRPDLSPLIVDQMQGSRRMGRMLDQRFASLGNEIGRLVVVRWVLANCHVPGDPQEAVEEKVPSRVQPTRRLIVQEYGTGAVH